MATNAIILMGSKSYLAQTQGVAKKLKTLEVTYRMRVCSAHKATTRLLEILKEYESHPEPLRQRTQTYKEQMVADLANVDREVYGL